jgi:diguanylate cyclase (GGDEF)-like protein
MLNHSSPLPPCPVGREFCPVLEELARIQDECQRFFELSQIDPLTGLFNRRHLMTELDREMERTRRSGLSTSIIMVDLDDFKGINDTLGHPAGDAVLRWVANRWRQNVRKLDILCRYGGDEFAVVLPGTSLPPAMKLARRLKSCLHHASLELEGETVSITASFGVDIYSGEEDLDPSAFLKRADKYLLEAKARGRNRVWHGDRRRLITTVTLQEREQLFPGMKASGKDHAQNQKTAAVLPHQR